MTNKVIQIPAKGQGSYNRAFDKEAEQIKRKFNAKLKLRKIKSKLK